MHVLGRHLLLLLVLSLCFECQLLLLSESWTVVHADQQQQHQQDRQVWHWQL